MAGTENLRSISQRHQQFTSEFPNRKLEGMELLNLFYSAVAAFSLAVFSAWRFVVYAERQQWWTLRLRLSLWQPYVLASWILCATVSTAFTLYDLRSAISSGWNDRAALCNMLAGLAIGGCLVTGADLAARALETRHYVRLRWKVWTGPSRTGITPSMGVYIGGAEDWASLARQASLQRRSIERSSGSLFNGRGKAIIEDPTDLLRARAVLDQGGRRQWAPQSLEKAGVFQPTAGNQSVSLLWGEHLGFRRRCSCGIISVPPNLLRVSPSLESGLDGQAICLAYGILARNKGLDPATLICNLGKAQRKGNNSINSKASNSFRTFEEGGLWPHPAKTLRGFYHAEFNRTFSLLGDSYVTAATELALLLADAHPSMISAWLDLRLEHQDLLLNHQAHALGASADELHRLYRGHYAAMLVSLSLFRGGIYIRPELTVFDAVCRLEGVGLPAWALSSDMVARRRGEQEAYGLGLQRLVDAVI
jgi:hypothetical protein